MPAKDESRDFGRANRSGPTGGTAKGMPKNWSCSHSGTYLPTYVPFLTVAKGEVVLLNPAPRAMSERVSTETAATIDHNMLY